MVGVEGSLPELPGLSPESPLGAESGSGCSQLRPQLRFLAVPALPCSDLLHSVGTAASW